MNIKKIIMSGVLLSLFSPCPVLAGNMEPDWVKVHRWGQSNKDLPVREFDKYQGSRTDNEDKNPYIWHGQFSSSIYNLVGRGGLKKKIVVTQKVPCYVVPINYGKGRPLCPKCPMTVNPDTKAVKTGANTVTVYKGGGGIQSGGTQNTRLFDVSGINVKHGDRIRHKKDATPSTARLIAGDGFSCLDKPNSETWEVYWKLKGKWVLMAKEVMK